mgnify:CR=1 FL=1
MVPLSGECGTLRNLVDCLRDGLGVRVDAAIANNVVAVNVLDRLSEISLAWVIM